MRDSYIRFFSKGYISKEEFFEFGLKETIYAPYEKAEKEWSRLKHRINNNEVVYIRGFGRDAAGTHLFQEFYRRLLGNENIKKDSTNNAEPTKLIKKLTGYAKTQTSNFEEIRNYQISHIFGRTKNVFAFTAPWNIVYMPKMLDPFTGHEAKGEMIDEYTKLFQQQGFKQFGNLIEEFNEIMTNNSFKESIEHSLCELEEGSSFTNQDVQKLRKAVTDEFRPIEIKA